MIKRQNFQKKLLLTRQEEFDLLKLIIDKFMWLAVLFIGIGLFYVYDLSLNSQIGVLFTLTGAIIVFLITSVFMKNIHMKK